MENDSVRTSGENTLVDVWIEGKMRSICVSRPAIAAFLQLPPERAAALADEDCREFVRTHLSLVANAAKDLLRSADPDTDTIIINGVFASADKGAQTGDRRQGERRRGDRRKVNLGPPPSGERRS
jgi:hypothetical protein